jgi:hypothetical protein
MRPVAKLGSAVAKGRWSGVFLSFGPQAQQYRAYVRAGAAQKAGTARPTTDVVTFYGETRARAFPATFSAISGLGPPVVFGGTVVFLEGLLADGGQPAGLEDNLEGSQLPIDAFCRSSGAHGPLLNAIFGATVHFAATHAALAVICLVALAVSVICALNTLKTHGCPWISRWAIAVLVPLGLGAAAFLGARAFAGKEIAELFARMSVITAPKSGCGVLSDGETLGRTLDWHSVIGAGAVSLAVSSLVVAAACLAYRYERQDINGAWSDSYVLRQKLNSLLTLFFIASALLVMTNVALNSVMGWSGAILDVISDTTGADAKEEPPPAAAASDLGSPTAGGKAPVEAKTPADPQAKARAAAFASIKSLRSSISTFAGILGSLVLIVIFVPALYGVTADIELAGKCHAFYDMRSGSDPRQNLNITLSELPSQQARIEGVITSEPTPPEDPDRIVVAGWKTVQAWKEKHGLTLSFTDLTGSFVAVLAPILSTSVIDLTKIAVGSG